MMKNFYKDFFEELAPTEGFRERLISELEVAAAKPRPAKAKRLPIITAIAAAALISAGGAAYAQPAVRMEGGRLVIELTGIPRKPVKGFTLLRETGEPVPSERFTYDSGDDFVPSDMYKLRTERQPDGSCAVRGTAYSNGEMMILCSPDGGGFFLEAGQRAALTVHADFSAEYNFSPEKDGVSGELTEAGYILGDKMHILFGGRTDGEYLRAEFTAEESGEYFFYLINCSAGLQNYSSAEIITE